MARHTRVYQVAKEHRISSEVLMGILPDLGIEVKNHLDKLEDEELDRVAEWFAKYPDGEAPSDTGESAAEEAPTAEPSAASTDAETPEADIKPEKTEEKKQAEPAPHPVMPPPEVVTTQVFMPPVETTPPPPPPPKPAARQQPKQVEKKPAVEEAAKGDELRQTPKRTETQVERTSKPEKTEKTDKPDKAKRSKRDERPERAPERRREEGTRDPEVEEISGRKIVRGHATTDRVDPQGAAGAGRRRRTKRKKKPVASQEEIQKNVQKTLTEMGRGRTRRTYDRRGSHEEEEIQEERNVVRVTEFVSVSEFADLMDVKANEVIAACLKLGLMVSLNQRLDWDTILVIADEFDFEVEQMEEKEVEEVVEEEDRPEDLLPRHPVVTVMGHVDHGKTSLLDYIRKTNVIGGESGGITQHIGAYEVETANGRVTFLDTPGHEAFTAMRARGAQVTDVVVLVIAADDAVMPQTVEAINHARAANVPLFVAINKVDLPAANPAKIKQQLTEYNVVVEEFGGKSQAVEISAKTGQGINELLEMLALETELLDLKANPNKPARGVVVEARLDKGRGPVATVLVESGTLRIGDPFLAGMHAGRVRAMLDERGNRIEEAGPSKPVQVLGLGDVPTAGDSLLVYHDEREARDIAQYRQQLKREQDYNRTKKISLRNISERISDGELKTLPVIVKGDVDGSV
ncbi:MAG TPA: translation initiation factor IF-2, partial [Firmicutes bacterium]|nr:translation initiation factor IF-2 [Bacillota bacterium]